MNHFCENFKGLENIYILTRTNRKLSIYLEAHDGESRTANYSTFYIDGADTEYVNHVSKHRHQESMSYTTAYSNVSILQLLMLPTSFH